MSETTTNLITTILLAVLALWLSRQQVKLPKQIAAHLLPQQEEQARQQTEAALSVQEFRGMMADFRGVMMAMQKADSDVITEQRQQIADSNSIIAQARRDIVTMTAALSDERMLGLERDKRLDTYRSMLDENQKTSDKKIEDLQAKIDSLNAALTGTQQVLEETQAKLTATQHELELTREDLRKTKLELEVALRRIGEITRDRDAERMLADEQKRRLEEELAAEHLKVEALQQQVGEQQSRITFLEGEVARLTTELAQRPNATETSVPPTGEKG